MTKFKFLFLTVVLFVAFNMNAATVTVDVSTMTTGGPYAGKITSPFNGVALYANGDYASKKINLNEGSGIYNIKLTGASNNSTKAGVSLYIDGKKVAEFSFTGTSATTSLIQKTLTVTSSTEVKLMLENDNGTNDTYLKTIEFQFVKKEVERPAPTIPTQGSYETGVYRNMFKEAGYTDAEVTAKLNNLWNTYFCGDGETERLYYEYGTDEAYILDVHNNDVRSEGMSYGMMICVQMNKQAEFDRLWKYVKNHMMHTQGAFKGYIGWKIDPSATTLDKSTASDGDEYIAMALMFAAGRWGNKTGIFNYWKEANDILNNSISKDHLINCSVVNMFSKNEMQIVFVPYASSAQFTDPSYHMPAFYRLWSKWANYNRQFWAKVAEKSCAMYLKFANANTGLMPDYANFDGTPCGAGHQEFRYDAWRCAMHMGNDYAWFAKSTEELTQIDKLISFFEKEGITSYGSEYNLDGKIINKDHSAGLVACNATATLASNRKSTWDIIDDMMSMKIPTGTYRYYDGTLFFLNFLHASGNFRIYKPAEVLDKAYDEQYKYTSTHLIIDNYETVPEGYNYYMYMREDSQAKATVATDPKNASNHALHITPANYEEYYYLDYTLPEGKKLGVNYKQIDFDLYYTPNIDDNKNQDFKVAINTNTNTVYTEKTGTSHGVWKHVSIPVNTDYGNNFKLFLGIRTKASNIYIDNLSLKGDVPTGIESISDSNNTFYPTGIYDLSGRKVSDTTDTSNLEKGLYIINGKKIYIN